MNAFKFIKPDQYSRCSPWDLRQMAFALSNSEHIDELLSLAKSKENQAWRSRKSLLL